MGAAQIPSPLSEAREWYKQVIFSVVVIAPSLGHVGPQEAVTNIVEGLTYRTAIPKSVWPFSRISDDSKL